MNLVLLVCHGREFFFLVKRKIKVEKKNEDEKLEAQYQHKTVDTTAFLWRRLQQIQAFYTIYAVRLHKTG